VKPKVKILPLLSILSLTLLPISCDDEDIYTGPWQEVPTPGGEGYLAACYFNSPADGWACGIESAGTDRMILIYWNGTEWTEYEYPGWFDDYGNVTSIDLWDISFSSPDNGWCVGRVGLEDIDGFSFILRYNGNEWYLFNDNLENAYGVYCVSKNDVWIISDSNNSDLYHWNGVDFEYYNLYPGNYGLLDIAFGSTNEGLAVGDYQFVYHWDGATWDLITYGFGGEYVCVAYDTPTTAFIGGDNLARWENDEFHWDYDYNGTYNGLHFSSSDEGWMFGGEPVEGIPQGDGFIWHWDGVEWTRSEMPHFMSPRGVFSIDYSDAWIVGMLSNYDGLGPECCSWRYIP